MERLKKGETYCYIDFGTMAIRQCIFAGDVADELRIKNNNRFKTYIEAEKMAKKLRAVLKGADVIEMPSEEDVTEKIFSTAGEIVGRDREITVSDCMKTAKAVVGWLIDKIVK